MAWVAALAGAAVSAYGANQQNRAQRGAGQVDVTHESNPWGPSSDYRLAGMEAAYNQQFGQTPWWTHTQYSRLPGQPNTPDTTGSRGNPGTGGGGGQGASYNPKGQQVIKGNPNAKNPKNRRDRTVGGEVGSPYAGQSAGTSTIQDAMIANAQRGNPLYGEAESYISDTISGEGDRNQYRTETAGMLRDLDNEDLRRYTEMLFEGEMPGSGRGRTGQSASEARSRGYGAGAYGTQAAALAAAQAEQASLVGVRGDLRGILDGGDTPGAAAMRERIRREGGEAYAEMAKDLRLRSVGSGMYGGTPYQQAESDALSRSSQGISDALAAQDYNMYGQALGLGTQYDIASQDRAAQERAAANASASAGRASEAGYASQERLARMGALQDAIGMRIGLDQYRSSGMGSLGEGMSADQRFALGATPDITGLSARDWTAAGQVSLGADANRNNWRSGENSRAVGMAGVGVDRARLNFDRYRYDREAPMNDIQAYMNIVNQASGGYGTSRDYGMDRRNQSPSYVNTGGQAIAGAAAGASLYNQWNSGR